MDPYGDPADGIIDNAIEELLEWARLHGYDPNENGCVFLGSVIEYVSESIDKPEDYDFAELLQKAKDSGVFEKIPIRSFDDKFPPDRQQDYVIAMSDDGDIGIFYDGMYMLYKGQYREISRDEVPLDWVPTLYHIHRRRPPIQHRTVKCRPAPLHEGRGDLRPAARILPAHRHDRTGRASEQTTNGTKDGVGNGTNPKTRKGMRRR